MSFHRFVESVFAATMRALAREIAPFLQPPPRSKPPAARLIREDESMALVYGIEVPPPTAPDVVKTELSAVVNGGEETIVEVTADSEFSYEQGDTVVWKCRGVDDADNRAEWSDEFTFTATDTLPPPRSGAPNPVLLREE